MRPSTATLLVAASLLLPRSAEARPSFSAAYFGEFATHPGVVLGVDAVVASKAHGRHQSALVLAGNVGAYAHVRNHVGAFADAEVGYRLTFGSGFLLEAFAGLGYLHTFLAAPTYVVDDQGHAERITDAGRPAFMPVASLGVGWRQGPVTPFLRLEAFGQYPFNAHLLPHFALVAGARF